MSRAIQLASGLPEGNNNSSTDFSIEMTLKVSHFHESTAVNYFHCA
ncbi:hypothetical protein FDUTEX481_05040 [Tolypothrix sp. PCC 7601]|nr:hypothetical protein FDUTEX481_05040 [Tolypothrix sp. PCC 7601]